MCDFEIKYESMTESQRQFEVTRIERNVSFLKTDVSRMESLLARMKFINSDITQHERELKILGKQKRFAEQEAMVLCA